MMKVETGSFAANSNNVTVLLDDTTLNVKAVFLQISPYSITGKATTGFSDGVTNRSGSPRDLTYCITAYSGTTNKVAGKVTTNGFATAGQFDMYFLNYDANYPIDFTVVGD